MPAQVWVTEDVKVIPLFPPQSPLLPVIAARFHEAVPAPVISIKLTLEAVTVVLQVIVIGVPAVSDETMMRLIVELPARVRVPVTVKLPVIDRPSVKTAVPVRVRLATVKADPPGIVCRPDPDITRLIPL